MVDTGLKHPKINHAWHQIIRMALRVTERLRWSAATDTILRLHTRVIRGWISE
jgi:hypothetical protein